MSSSRRSATERLLLAFPLVLFLGAIGVIVVLGFSNTWLNAVRLVRSRPMSITIIDKQNVQYVRNVGMPRRIQTTVYRPIVVYEYEVDGYRYENNRIWPTRLTVDSEWATETLGRYEVGQSYQGFYDPYEPTASFLIKDFDVWSFAGSIFGLMLFGVISAMSVRHVLKG